MRSLKDLKGLIWSFQFNNAEQTRKLQWQTLQVLLELNERLVKLEGYANKLEQGAQKLVERNQRRRRVS